MTATVDLFLSPAELIALTGYRLAKYQVAWLNKRGWKHETTASGTPRVARAYFERRMVGQAATPDPSPPARHNFGALRVVK